MTNGMKQMVMTVMLALVALAARAQQGPCYTRTDSLFIVQTLQPGEKLTMVELARKFLGRPYVAHTLEANDEERLVVNTRQLDCTTLVENVVALYLCQQQGKHGFADFVEMLTKLRYRQGVLQGYTSRLHYFSDWILDNTRMGFVSELQSPNPPFTTVQKQDIGYMSKHPQAYKALRQHPEWITDIERQEKRLNGLLFRYIPKSGVVNMKRLRDVIHDGDILAITCSKPGLEIAHLGFAVWQADGLHLLNASQLHKKVVLEPMTLRQYLQKHPSHTGIRVIRVCAR